MNLTDILRRARESAPVPDKKEIVLDGKTGLPRQAGASQAEGAYVKRYKRRAEESLYFFAKGVLGLSRLTSMLHMGVCEWLAKIPPYRKCLLLPRDHLKTSIVSRTLPMHILIQPKESNVYVPGRLGRDLRILLAGETAKNAENQLGWIATRFLTSSIIRAFWPGAVWENPKTQARMWNAQSIVLPREQDFPEGSIDTIGVGGAVTGRHFDIQLKDDLVTFEAANSPALMQTAIVWHEASRALFDDPDKGLEFIVGTRWSVQDLYNHIQENDPSVQVLKRAVIEDGKPIFPEMFTLETIDELQKRLGVLFPLLYMNNASDPALTDFDIEQVREFRIVEDTIVFEEDERDVVMRERINAPATVTTGVPRGQPIDRETWGTMFGRGDFVRVRYG